jgi:triosephosphate isomerase
MKRKEIFAGNWKMYKDSRGAEELLTGLIKGMTPKDGREYAVFVPAPYASLAVKVCAGSKIQVGMQNMYFENEGAFTGEISPLMVKDCGCSLILIGHSERRHVFKETNEEVNKKVLSALSHGINPMVCVGELLEEREAGQTMKVVREQVEKGLKGVEPSALSKISIAYEPVWAIGTGKVATPEMADEAHAGIRSVIKELYGQAAADAMPILYGGSVKADNVEGLYKKENIDGFLVGGASLKPDTFLPIVNVL